MKVILINSIKHGIKECFVDDDDFDYLNQWKWKLLVSYNSMYAVRNITTYLGGGRKNKQTKSSCILMHRLIMGVTDKTILVDHIDNNGLNNQKVNMRLCTKAENNRNVIRHKDSKYSIYKGVSFDKSRGLWVSQVRFNGKNISAGRFSDELEAAKAYNKISTELFGEFAKPNQL